MARDSKVRRQVVKPALCRNFALLLACSLCIASSTAAQQTETFEYTIMDGDTCAKISRKFFGPRRWDVIHKYNPGMGPTPHTLVPGQKLTLPLPDASADAELTSVQRTVQSREPQRANWRRARRGDDLYRGWRVNTLESSAAELTFRDASVVQMRENTLVIIYGDTSETTRRRTNKAELERGELRSRLGELRLAVETPSGTADLEGGSSLVSVDRGGASRLSHHEGAPAKLRTKDGKGAVSVKSGFGSKVAKGDPAPSTPKPLPPAPTWKTNRPAHYVGLASGGASVAAEWAGPEVAQSYRVTLAKNESGKDLLVSRAVPKAITRVEVHGLPPGQYFASVATVDDDAFESKPSKTLRMVVELAQVVPPGATEPVVSPPSDNPNEAQRPRVMRGTRLIAPPGFSCAVGSQDPAEELTLTEAGTTELRCVGPKGVHTEPSSFVVVAPRIVQANRKPVGALAPGKPKRLKLQILSEFPLPQSARLVTPPSVTLQDKGLVGNARLVVLTAQQRAPDRFTLDLVAESEGKAVTLSELELTVGRDAKPTTDEAQPDVSRAEPVDTRSRRERRRARRRARRAR